MKKGDVFSGGPSNLHTINQVIAKTGLGQSGFAVSESLLILFFFFFFLVLIVTALV